jgi:hypothetical protein
MLGGQWEYVCVCPSHFYELEALCVPINGNTTDIHEAANQILTGTATTA